MKALQKKLLLGILAYGHKDAYALESIDSLPCLMANHASSGDLIIFLGAGDCTQWAYDLPSQLEDYLENSGKEGHLLSVA